MPSASLRGDTGKAPDNWARHGTREPASRNGCVTAEYELRVFRSQQWEKPLLVLMVAERIHHAQIEDGI